MPEASDTNVVPVSTSDWSATPFESWEDEDHQAMSARWLTFNLIFCYCLLAILEASITRLMKVHPGQSTDVAWLERQI